jgi:hypothetical protein
MIEAIRGASAHNSAGASQATVEEPPLTKTA